MFDYAKSAARASGLPEGTLDLKVGVAEDLPAETSSFDTVICSLASIHFLEKDLEGYDMSEGRLYHEYPSQEARRRAVCRQT